MSVYWMWWIAAAALIAAELLTGTFYLLAVGIAVACGGVVLLEQWKRGRGATPSQPALDVGQMVRVQSWGPDRTARVSYRGSTWDAELAAPETPQAETMYIAGTRGSVLILSDRRPAS